MFPDKLTQVQILDSEFPDLVVACWEGPLQEPHVELTLSPQVAFTFDQWVTFSSFLGYYKNELRTQMSTLGKPYTLDS